MNDKLFTFLTIIFSSIFVGSLIYLIKQKRFKPLVHIIITIIYTILVIIGNLLFFKDKSFEYFQSLISLSIFLPFLILLLILSKQRIFTSMSFILNANLSIFSINILRGLALRYVHIDPLIIDSISFVLYPIIWTYVKYFYLDLENELDIEIPKICPILFLYTFLAIAELMIYKTLADMFDQPLLRYEIFSAAVLSVYFVSFFIFNQLFKAYKNRLVDTSNEEIIHKEAHYIEDKLMAYQLSKEELKIIKHDLKHVLITISQLMSNNQLEEANNYIQNFTEIIDTVADTKKYSNNPIIDSVISYYVSYCEKNGIKFNLQLDEFENTLNISDLDFSVFISNCLENAVNATNKLSKNKEISFSLINNKNRFIMQIKNTYNGKIKLDKNNYPMATTKNHGIGTTSIKWFIKKYNWDLNYEISKTHFTISILFNNNIK